MTDDLVLHTHPMFRGGIARWMLEEVVRPAALRASAIDDAQLDEMGATKPPA